MFGSVCCSTYIYSASSFASPSVVGHVRCIRFASFCCLLHAAGCTDCALAESHALIPSELRGAAVQPRGAASWREWCGARCNARRLRCNTQHARCNAPTTIMQRAFAAHGILMGHARPATRGRPAADARRIGAACDGPFASGGPRRPRPCGGPTTTLGIISESLSARRTSSSTSPRTPPARALRDRRVTPRSKAELALAHWQAPALAWLRPPVPPTARQGPL